MLIVANYLGNFLLFKKSDFEYKVTGLYLFSNFEETFYNSLRDSYTRATYS